jgi:glycosyltransferase involved in cell wall biosynthesis
VEPQSDRAESCAGQPGAVTPCGTARAPVAFFLPSLAGGGAERVILNLAEGFSQRGVPIDLVLATAEGPFLSQVPPGVRVVDLKASRVWRSLGPLAAYLRRERPLALLAALDHANLVAMAAARIAGGHTRTVISVHRTFPKNGQATSMRESAIPWLLGRLHRWADAIVAVSEGVAVDLANTAGIPRDRIRVIYNPVIMPSLLPAAAERPSHPWFEDATPIVIGVGRLVPQKNFRLLIDAFAIVSRSRAVRLIILGEGPERQALEKQIGRLNLQDSVALPGFLDNPYACMARAAAFALSSDFEGLPTALIESLAVGTPVVATDCESGPREILRGGALGGLVPVGDAAALAGGITRALDRPRAAPPAEALRPFTLDAAVDQFQEAFDLHA